MPATRRSTRTAAAAKSRNETNEESQHDPPGNANVTSSPKRKGRAGTPSPTKKKCTGLSTAVTNVSQSLGVIDAESNITGNIKDLDGEPCDVMLVLIDPAKNMDKFYILQFIQSHDDKWVVYTRWGRTGTVGQALVQDFSEMDAAIKCFRDKFKEKSGLEWEDRGEPIQGGKYRFVQQNFVEKQAGFANSKWQYWVDDGVDGKTTGWYDYDPPASRQVERLYTEYSNQPECSTRFVDSGVYTYEVDLQRMVQTNVTHANHTSRRIRRCPNGIEMDDHEAPPAMLPPVVPSSGVLPAAVPSSSVLPSTPMKTPSSTSVATTPVVPVSTASAINVPKVTPSSKPTKATHPVDKEISVQGKNHTDYCVVQGDGDWYDVTLNQCNIAGNNNKYYRLQILRETTSNAIYVWFRWGRVGERATAGASTWSGPFATVDAAHSVFAKKYRAKTGNAFGADTFVEKKGKYVPVEIDNDVEVDEDFQASNVADNNQEEEIEYLPSALDAKTQELVSVLFSREMRNTALTSLNLDLKKLPLGVPSLQQIQRGVDILTQIEDKLNGGTSDDSFADLSSRFYTAIPHSFGRSRPPVISTKESLQSRFDMCNILRDMYSTNETIQRIENQRKTITKTIIPHPLDQHYLSLNADLALVQKTDEAYGLIQEYFEKTKASYSKAQLLNVWSVNRNGESQRFTKKFSDVGNRRLLWHGTNIAVVAPILTSGLRIMPHSGGRVGSGIYLANLQEKSAQYTSGYGFACMFLCEAPLGKQHTVNADGHHASSLKKAPDGHDSVHAVGRMAPKKHATLRIDGQDVAVPQSKAEATGLQSSFQHDEFLVYDEAQVRIRFMLTVKF